MNTKDHALDLALKALESERDKYLEWGDEDGAPDDVHEAITAIKQARSASVQDKCFLCGERIESCASTVCPKATPPAAPVQEPVAQGDAVMNKDKALAKEIGSRTYETVTRDDVFDLAFETGIGLPVKNEFWGVSVECEVYELQEFAELVAEKARREEREACAAPTVPDALTDRDPETAEYREGWNDCRALMLNWRNDQ